MKLVRTVVCSLLVASGLALAGCHASARDACQALADCVKKIDPKSATTASDVDKCVADLENDKSCPEDKKQEAVDCIADMKCENQTSAVGEIITCAGKCPMK